MASGRFRLDRLRADDLAPALGCGFQTGDPSLDAWIEPFIAEISVFPAAPAKDQADALSGAYAALQTARPWQGNDILLGASQIDRGPYGSSGYSYSVSEGGDLEA